MDYPLASDFDFRLFNRLSCCKTNGAICGTFKGDELRGMNPLVPDLNPRMCFIEFSSLMEGGEDKGEKVRSIPIQNRPY